MGEYSAIYAMLTYAYDFWLEVSLGILGKAGNVTFDNKVLSFLNKDMHSQELSVLPDLHYQDPAKHSKGLGVSATNMAGKRA